jgi:transcriptional regulator with XRE-family HTH domain
MKKSALRIWFEDTGVTFASFAKSVGCDESAVSYWVAGKRHPSLRFALKISMATGIELEDLLPKDQS